MATQPPGPPLSQILTKTTVANISDADLVKAFNFRIANPDKFWLKIGNDVGNGQQYIEIYWNSVTGAQAMVDLLRTLSVFQG